MAEADRGERTIDPETRATAMPGEPLTAPIGAAQAANDPPVDPPLDVSRRRLGERLRRIAPFFAGSRRGFVLAIVGALVAAATEPAIPALLKVLLDDGIDKSRFPLWVVPIAVIGLTAIRGLAGFASQYGLAWAANRGTQAMRRSMFQRLLDAEPALFNRNTASNLVNTLTFEVQNGATQLVYSLQSLVGDSLRFLALLGYLVWLNWQLTTFVALLLPALAYVMRKFSRRLHRVTVEGQHSIDELAYVVEENVLAWRSVRLHGAETSQASRFERVSNQLRRLSMKSVVAAATMTPVTQLLASCALAAVIVAALWQSGRTGTSVGSFVAFIVAMLQLVPPIKHLSELAGPVTRGLAALDKGVGLIDGSRAETGGSFDPGRSAGHLELRGVTLRYRSAQAPALDSIDLELRAGETVALVGPSGAGKTTLVNLLPRFIEPSAGKIMLDGHALADWNVVALRRQFALVSQEVVLFNDSVAANVSLGTNGDGGDRARVRAALASANLLDFAEALPNGLDTVVGHNAREFSGGQRQRLAIARAIYKDAPILILDEATSALDNESERLVQQALERLMKGRTSLVIAHRLSTIERADRIVVIDAGRVVESGSHAELIAAGGLYARLHSQQFRSRAMNETTSTPAPIRPISRFPVPALEGLPTDVREKILAVQEKAGFVPNVFLALAHRPDEFRAFFAYHDALLLRESGLTKGDKEMIIVATSGANHCLYCVVAHGALLRIYEKNPLVADQVAVNHRKADITPRQRAMLDFAMKVALASHEIGDDDFAALSAHGFSADDAWDIAGITALFGLSNRIANVASMRPNDEFYLMGRVPRPAKG
ncbi:MAG: lipid A export permease/ATP-binding protein MsbA [Caldimonas sp.]